LKRPKYFVSEFLSSVLQYKCKNQTLQKAEDGEKAEEDAKETEVDSKAAEKKDPSDEASEADKEASDGVAPPAEATADDPLTEDNLQEAKKGSSLLDSLKNIKAPKVPALFKAKKRDGEEEGKREEGEEEKLLETKEEEKEEKEAEKEEAEEVKEKEEKGKSNMSSLLSTIRSVTGPGFYRIGTCCCYRGSR
jgi:hypothetical protein